MVEFVLSAALKANYVKVVEVKILSTTKNVAQRINFWQIYDYGHILSMVSDTDTHY